MDESVSTAVDGCRRRLGRLAALGHDTEAAEHDISRAAGAMLKTVQADIERLRPHVFLEDNAARQYRDALLERSRLEMIIRQFSAHIQ